MSVAKSQLGNPTHPAMVQLSACAEPGKSITIIEKEIEAYQKLRQTVKAAYLSAKSGLEQIDQTVARLHTLKNELKTKLT